MSHLFLNLFRAIRLLWTARTLLPDKEREREQVYALVYKEADEAHRQADIAATRNAKTQAAELRAQVTQEIGEAPSVSSIATWVAHYEAEKHVRAQALLLETHGREDLDYYVTQFAQKEAGHLAGELAPELQQQDAVRIAIEATAAEVESEYLKVYPHLDDFRLELESIGRELSSHVDWAHPLILAAAGIDSAASQHTIATSVISDRSAGIHQVGERLSKLAVPSEIRASETNVLYDALLGNLRTVYDATAAIVDSEKMRQENQLSDSQVDVSGLLEAAVRQYPYLRQLLQSLGLRVPRFTNNGFWKAPPPQ